MSNAILLIRNTTSLKEKVWHNKAVWWKYLYQDTLVHKRSWIVVSPLACFYDFPIIFGSPWYSWNIDESGVKHQKIKSYYILWNVCFFILLINCIPFFIMSFSTFVPYVVAMRNRCRKKALITLICSYIMFLWNILSHVQIKKSFGGSDMNIYTCTLNFIVYDTSITR